LAHPPSQERAVAEEDVVLSVPGLAELLTEVGDVLGGGPDEDDAFQMRHFLPLLVVEEVEEEHLLAQDVASAVHRAHGISCVGCFPISPIRE